MYREDEITREALRNERVRWVIKLLLMSTSGTNGITAIHYTGSVYIWKATSAGNGSRNLNTPVAKMKQCTYTISAKEDYYIRPGEERVRVGKEGANLREMKHYCYRP